MNKKDIEKMRHEWLAALPGDEMDKCDWEIDYATVLLNEVERLQTIIKTCEKQLDKSFIKLIDDEQPRDLAVYETRSIRQVYKTLSQAIEGE